jgi:hypothetical protein
MVWLVDIDPQLDRLAIQPQKGHHRSAPSLNTKGRERLNVKAFMEKGNGQDF